jgi:hypothetical protein
MVCPIGVLFCAKQSASVFDADCFTVYTCDEARRIAANIAKLFDFLKG